MPKIMGSSLAEHRERTRTALFEALSELMGQRSFDRITLSDVATPPNARTPQLFRSQHIGIHGVERCLLIFFTSKSRNLCKKYRGRPLGPPRTMKTTQDCVSRV